MNVYHVAVAGILGIGVMAWLASHMTRRVSFVDSLGSILSAGARKDHEVSQVPRLFIRFGNSCKSLLILVMLGVPVTTAASGNSQSWDFSVFLDDDKIGYHRFDLIREGNERRVTSEAKFDVRFLFVNAFRYRHSNTEVWSDGCLRQIEARTQANSKKLMVSGTTVADQLVIDDGAGKSTLTDCVMTFAYWNPEFLQQPRLLNSQSGEYLDVEVESLGREPIMVRGQEVDASVYKVSARQLELTLWYSTDNEWLALESVANGGRIIRYELS